MLYLIESGDYIKVGYTKDIKGLKKRMQAYRTHNPNFRLVGIKDGDKEEESTYHKGNQEWILIPDNYESIKEKFFIDPSLERYKGIADDKPVVSYQQLIKDYYENFDESYEVEHPEFKLYKKYLTLKNLNSLRFNKDKALKEIDKKRNFDVSKLECGKFYTNAEIKALVGAKATSILDYFEVVKTKVNKISGYRLISKKTTK